MSCATWLRPRTARPCRRAADVCNGAGLTYAELTRLYAESTGCVGCGDRFPGFPQFGRSLGGCTGAIPVALVAGFMQVVVISRLTQDERIRHHAPGPCA